MFQVVMNKVETQMQGTGREVLEGLCHYIETLNKSDIDLDTIQKVCNYAIEELKKEKKKDNTNRVKTIHREKDFTVHEINIDGLSGEEVKDILTEIFNKRK